MFDEKNVTLVYKKSMENNNPLSPHLQIYKWQISSLLSITHRIVGVINFFAIILICLWAVFIILGQDNYSNINIVLKLSVSLDTIKKRISERQIQEKRSDDSEEIAIKRYETYEKSSAPVLDYYKQSNLLKVVNGEATIAKINSEISGLIEGIKG